MLHQNESQILKDILIIVERKKKLLPKHAHTAKLHLFKNKEDTLRRCNFC